MSQTNFLDLQRLADQEKPELGIWLRLVMQRWREGEAFERAADLTGYGALAAAKRELIAAAELLDPEHKLGPWRLAGMIHQALRDFERRRWTAVKGLSSPETLSSLEGCLWRGLMNSTKLPRSHDRIYELLAQKGWQRQCAP